VSVTISIGVAERSAKSAMPDDVLKAADEALYRAKSKGRNQVSR
jgi:diguanylate cyclase (GGDEF)-like protein